MITPGEEAYARLMSRLAQAFADHRAERDAAEREYAERCAAAQAAVAQATEATRATSVRLRAARDLVTQVDSEAGELWQTLQARLVGRAGIRLPGLPPPAGEEELAGPGALAAPGTLAGGPGERTGADTPAAATVAAVSALLGDADDLLASAVQRQSVGGAGYLALAVLGALVTSATYGLARLVLLAGHALGGPVGLVLIVVGQIAVFLAPLAGLAWARWYLDRRHARLDVPAVAAVVIGGLAAECSFGLLLR